MKALTRRTVIPRRIVPILGHAATAYIVLALGIAISAGFAAWTSTLVEREAQQRFEYEIANGRDKIEARLDAYADVLLGVRGLFIAGGTVGRSEFRDYIASLDVYRRYPGVQ